MFNEKVKGKKGVQTSLAYNWAKKGEKGVETSLAYNWAFTLYLLFNWS